MKFKWGKKILIGLLLIGGIVGFLAYDKYAVIMSSNVPDELAQNIVIIPSQSSFETVVGILQKNKQIKNADSFSEVAGMMNYKKEGMRSGRYQIKPFWGNRSLISHLRAGKQAPVKVVLNHGWILLLNNRK